MNKQLKQVTHLLTKHRYYFFILIFCSLFLWIKSSNGSNDSLKSEFQVDTYIPHGFVLVPMEFKNSSTIDSVIGNFGFVTVYKSTGKSTKLVAKNVRLLRSPKNPNVFAVLSPQTQAHLFLDPMSEYSAVLQKHSPAGTVIEKKAIKRKIIYKE